MTTDKVLVQVGNEVIELKGTEKEEFLTRVAEDAAKNLIAKKEKEAKAIARQAVLDRLGLTEEEAQLILGGSN